MKRLLGSIAPLIRGIVPVAIGSAERGLVLENLFSLLFFVHKMLIYMMRALILPYIKNAPKVRQYAGNLWGTLICVSICG